MGDQPSGVALFASIMTALYRREKTGKGGEVYTSLMANGAWSNGSYIQAGLFNADFPDRQIEAPLHPFGGRYKTKDGRFLLLAIIDATKEWPKFLKAMNLEYLNEDEKFSSFKNLNSNFRDLYKILEEQFAQYNLSEVIDKLKNSGVTFGFMNKSNDLSEDRQFLDSEVLIKYDNKAFGDNSLTVNSPVFLKNEPKKIPEKGPELGEHTKQILLSLGKSEQDIKQLKKEGIIDF